MDRRRRRTARAREFLSTYTQDLTARDLQRLFTRDTREAYQFFARGIDPKVLAELPLRRRVVEHVRLLFLAFTLKLSPARRLIYALALIAAVIGLFESLDGFGLVRLPVIPFVLSIRVPGPRWPNATFWLLLGFLLLNLLVLLEVADRLLLKNDLEIARDIQQAMLPGGPHRSNGIEVCGMTRPANTVGGDFFDILPFDDGRVAIALGDVAGKGSPAALLMALLLAMLRTLIDEGLEPSELLTRLNVQVSRHAPASRFITLFFAVYDPAAGRLTYANAGHLPAIVRRRDGRFERLTEGGVALGLFGPASYEAFSTRLETGDLVLLYSDGLIEAEDPNGRPFDEDGLLRVVSGFYECAPRQLGTLLLDAVASHAQTDRFADDLTVLVFKRDVPVAHGPATPMIRRGA